MLAIVILITSLLFYEHCRRGRGQGRNTAVRQWRPLPLRFL